MQRELSLNLIKGHVGLVGIYAFVCLIDNKHVPLDPRNLFQLIELPSEVNGAFKILKGYEIDEAHLYGVRKGSFFPALLVRVIRFV